MEEGCARPRLSIMHLKCQRKEGRDTLFLESRLESEGKEKDLL